MRTPTIAVLTGCFTCTSAVVGLAAPNALPPSAPPQAIPSSAAVCKQLSDFQENPIQLLPEPFQKGCVFYTILRGTNPGNVLYVLKSESKETIPSVASGEVSVAQTETLDALVEQGQAFRIIQFTPVTLGAQHMLGPIPDGMVFVAWNDLCMKFNQREVACVESGAFRPNMLVEILRRNKEQVGVRVRGN